MYVMAKENDIYSGLAAAGAPAPAAAAAAAATEGGSGGGGGGEGEGAGAGEGEGGPPPAPAAPPAAPPAVLTPEEAAAVAATLHASAAARARTIARAFKSVTVSFLGGDFAVDFLEKGKLRGAFHALAVSGRAAHLVGKPSFRALAAPSGALLLLETARNIPSLTPEQRAAFSAKEVELGAGAGAALVGSDRALSADTFSVGTVLDARDFGGVSAAGRAAAEGAAAAAAAARAALAPLTAPQGLPPPPSGATFGGRPWVGEGGAPGEGPGSAKAARVNPRGTGVLSHNPPPLPAVAALRGGGAAAAAAAAAAMRAVAAALPKWDARGGDCPPPETLVFALLPEAAEAVAGEWGKGGGGGAGGADAAAGEAVVAALGASGGE
jgi:hypothetical protein